MGGFRGGAGLPFSWTRIPVVVPSMEEWAVSSNVTMQIWHRDWDRHHGHFFHNRFFVFDDGFWFGLDPWYYPYDRLLCVRRTRIITDPMRPPILIRCRWSVPSNRTWPGKVTIAV